MKDLGKGLAIVAACGVIGVAVWTTKSAVPVWGLVLVALMAGAIYDD